MSVNKVILIGRLGTEPESRAFPNGGSVCNLRIATSETWKDRQTGERQERTEWHRVVLRNRLGEVAQQYLHKGSQVYIEGRIQTRKYEKNGEDRFVTEIVGNEMTMLDSGGGQSGGGYQSSTRQTNQGQQTTAQDYAAAQSGAGASQPGSPMDDDIPFIQHERKTII